MRKYIITGMFLLIFCGYAAEDQLADIFKARDKELEKLKTEYENRTSEIDAAAIEKLVAIMKTKIAAKDFDGAKQVKQAIMSIENPQAQALKQEPKTISQSASASKEGERVVLKTQDKPVNANASKSEADKYPEGSFKMFGHYYYVFPVPMNYEDGKNACNALGGHYLSMDTDEEYDFFFKKANKDGKAYWLDLNYNAGKKNWDKWDGKPVSYTRWHKGFPADIENGSYAVMFNYANKKTDMVNVPGKNFTGTVVCEWEI